MYRDKYVTKNKLYCKYLHKKIKKTSYIVRKDKNSETVLLIMKSL